MFEMIAVGIIAVFLVLWIISLQRTFSAMNENVNNAMQQIGVQMSLRWDSLTMLLEIMKGYAEEEYTKFSEIVKEGRSLIGNSSPEEMSKQENIIDEVISGIMEVAERNPDFKEEKTYKNGIDAVNQYENMICTSRLIYNDSVMKLNREIHKIPASLFAVFLGFKKRDYFEERDAKTDRTG